MDVNMRVMVLIFLLEFGESVEFIKISFWNWLKFKNVNGKRYLII